MAGKAKQTVTTTKSREKKVPENSLKCPICGGKGHVPKGYNKKKT